MQTTIGLSKFSSSPSIRMECAHRQSRGLYLFVRRAERSKEEQWTNVLRYGQLIAKKTMDQSTTVQIIIMNINTLIPVQ